jgi:hypothetical protein
MAKSVDPRDMALGLPRLQQQWAESVHSLINGGIDKGIPQSKDSTGNYNTFLPGNENGVLIRVGASGSTDNKYVWTSSSTPIVINHGLLRQPVGAHLVSSNKSLNIWITSSPTVDSISIAPSDATAYATIYIF